MAVALVATGASIEVRADGASEAMGGPTSFRRLNESQYKRAIAQIFGDDIMVPGRFEPPVREDGLLAIGESHVIVTPAGFEQTAIRAREIAAQIMAESRRSRYLECRPAPASQFDRACAQSFFTKYGRLLYRRPLTEREMAAVLRLAAEATTKTGSFIRGVETSLGAMLSSPAFTFRIETSQADPALPLQRRLDPYSHASRISFLLWDAPPDEELLDSAARGELYTQEGLERQVARMMASPRLEQGVRAFFSDMLAYDQFEGLSKDPLLFPIFNPQLRNDAKEQSLRTIVDHLLNRQGDYRDLFVTRNTFLSRSLGALYGVRVDHRGFGGWMPYTFPSNSPHAGLLTMPAFLMLDPSHEGRSSPTIRGKVVRENFLCETVPPPPANVNFQIVQDVNNPEFKTARERLSAHNESPACAGCHKITDPIGLALENYTAVGAFRTHENGAPIDPSGEFEGKTYANAMDLTRLIRDSESASSCVVQRTLEYGVGRTLVRSEEAWVEALNRSFAASGYQYPALLKQIATSPAFRAVASPGIAARN
jgi:Protein of unknown function (DUF1592)/Protein of unknown function (DUF1588)/Protein of unknown function (DUF1595)/Protein of unknown function (DUF1585)